MKNKRSLCRILVLALAMILLVLPVSAQELTDNQQIEEAAATLREGIKNWENFITVTFTTDSSSFDGTTASANDLADQVLDLALAHTGAPDEGDYLRFNIGYMEPNAVNFTKQADGWQFSVTYYIVYWTTAEQEAAVDAEIENLVQQLELRSDMTDYQKVSVIYNYICGNVTYDYDRLNDNSYGLKFTTYAAAVDKTAVCQGYSTLFYRLALEAGVDNRIVTGEAINANGETESHSWNLVKLDGEYFYLDSTWDSEMYDFQWFLKSEFEFYNHTPDAEYLTDEFLTAYPVATGSYLHPYQNDAWDGDFQYQVMNGRAALIGYSGTDRDLVVPATLGGYPVYWIGGSSIYYNNYVESITFSEGIRIIESAAILECRNLKSIHLPSTVNFTASNVPDFKCNVICGPYMCPSVETITVAEGNPNLVVVDNVLYNKEMTILRYYPAGDPREVFEVPEGVLSIGAGAFADCKNLKEAKLSDTVLRVQMNAFQYCAQLEKFHISNSCHFIDQFNFSGTALKSIHIPASVKTLLAGTFGIDSILETITVDPGNPVYYVEDGVLYGRYSEGCNVDSCHMPGDWLVKYPAGRAETTFTVPEGIVGIEQHAFDCGANLQEIVLPDSLKTLYSAAFWGCSGLMKLELPQNLERIYNGVFEECISLVELVIPPSVNYLDYYLIPINHNLENLVFLGDMPEMYYETLQWLDVDIYYPAGNTTFSDAIEMNARSSRWHVGCAENYDAAQKHADYENVRWIEACASHQFTEEVNAPTCTIPGYTSQVCSVCGLVDVTGELIPATGHDMVLFNSGEPTCEGSGWTDYRCNICQEHIAEEYGDALGHEIDDDGFCVRCGFSSESAGNVVPLYRCKNCKELVTSTKIIHESGTCVNCMQSITNVQSSGILGDHRIMTLIFVGATVAFIAIFALIGGIVNAIQKRKKKQ